MITLISNNWKEICSFKRSEGSCSRLLPVEINFCKNEFLQGATMLAFFSEMFGDGDVTGDKVRIRTGSVSSNLHIL